MHNIPVIVSQRGGWVAVEGLNDDQEDALYEYLEETCGLGQTLKGSVGTPYKLFARGTTLSALVDKVRRYLTENSIGHRVL